jgi:DNA/RNA endonuclease G (NUC1)
MRVIILAIAVFLICCKVATGQQSLSVFGDTFPKVKEGQKIVTRHMYVACVDVKAKQPAWVGYRVQKSDWDTSNQLARNFSTPAELRPICLEVRDYQNSGYEMGHLYALQFVHASQHGHEVNQLCAIAAQTPELNKGPWLAIEERIKALSETEAVTVLAGQLWLEEMPALKEANEPHKIASHCWVMFKAGQLDEAYLIPQRVKRSDSIERFRLNRTELQGKVSDKWISP